MKNITLPEILGYLMHERGSGSLYAHILASLAYESTTAVPFMGVRASGKGYTLMVNPDWLEQADFDFVMTVIQHEAMHIVQQHIPRVLRRAALYAGTPDEALFSRVHNIGTDMAVNTLLVKANKYLQEHKDVGILPGNAPWKYPDDMSFEDYTELLMDWARKKNEEYEEFMQQLNKAVQNKLAQQGKDQQGEGGQGEGEGGDKNSPAPELSGGQHPWEDSFNNMSPEEKAALAQELADRAVDIVKTAVSDVTGNDSSKLRGLVPASICETIEKLLEPPKIPWQRVLRSMVINTRRFKYYRSLRRPNRRRVGIPNMSLFPSKAKDLSFTIGFIVDTSGSMGSKELQEAILELQGIQMVDKDVEIAVIEADAGVHNVYTIRAHDKVEPQFTGRGGTDFDPALIQTKGMALDVVFYYTDGYASPPRVESRVSVPFAWLITKNGVVPDKEWGKVIKLED